MGYVELLILVLKLGIRMLVQTVEIMGDNLRKPPGRLGRTRQSLR